ncbi:MAG: hypothetical protein N2C12_16165 [Planctomycetales bacterium]
MHRQFDLRPEAERQWMLANTWCDNGNAADLGMSNPRAYGIDGANMVGYYIDGSGKPHGFMVTATSPLPKPVAILLALFGLALLPRRRRR